MKFLKCLFFIFCFLFSVNTKSIVQDKPKDCNLDDKTWYEVRMYSTNHEYNYFRVKYISPFRYQIEAIYNTGDSGAIRAFLGQKTGNTFEVSRFKELYGITELEIFDVHVSKDLFSQIDEDRNTLYLINHLKGSLSKWGKFITCLNTK